MTVLWQILNAACRTIIAVSSSGNKSRNFAHRTVRSLYNYIGAWYRSACRLPSRAATPSTSTHAHDAPVRHKRRPKSSPPDASGGQVGEATYGSTNDFDSLTPSVVYELSEGQQPESLYGDRPESALDIIDDDGTQSLENDPDYQLSETGTRCRTPAIADRDTDIDSDEDDTREPILEEFQQRQMAIPQLELRPEKVDSFYIPGLPKGDRRKYDFDAEHVDIPPYEFAPALSQPLRNMNLKEICMGEKNWRELTSDGTEDAVEALIVDRLIELEKLQVKTEQNEERAKERAKSAKLRTGLRNRSGSARALSSRAKEKWCCPDCTQPACVGNCPTKDDAPPACLLCRGKHCTGTCTESAYCAHIRADRNEANGDSKSRTRLPPRLRSCGCCQRRHNAKFINANNLILGRPRSGNATFARGQSSQKPTDLRPKSAGGATVSTDMEKEFEKLGLNPTAKDGRKEDSVSQRPLTAGPRTGCRGRAGVIPGKSYFSQRRNSLTDSSARTRLRLAAAAKRRKSMKDQRPKTAG